MSSPSPLTLTTGARLITAGRDADGRSVFLSDRVVEPFSPFGPGGSSFSVLDVRDSVPVSNQEPAEAEAEAEAGGSGAPLPLPVLCYLSSDKI